MQEEFEDIMEQDEDDEDDNEDMEEEGEDGETKATNTDGDVYLPGKPLEEGEELVCDQSAYVMLHQAQTGAPCLSFDIIADNLGENRETFPMTAYVVAGTQASQAHMNSVIVMKLSNLHRTSKNDNEDDDDEDDSDSEQEEEDEAKKPKMAGALIKHQGCVNRIRTTTHNNTVLAASWSELGRISIWNLNQQLEVVNNDALLMKYNKENLGNSVTAAFTFSGHQNEGFAMDWSKTQSGMLATGDCKKDIHIWTPGEGTWTVDQRPLIGHKDSVEDIQWSPNERCVMASCSVDKTIRIWDTRAPPQKACMLTADNAHDSDVNVIHWNKHEPFIVSGGDDGVLKVWDLRRFQQKTPVAFFKHHSAPVTSVEWHPTDGAVFASAGADHQIALWDLSAEKDNETATEIPNLPAQLLFIHQGQTDLKELHWHPQLPGVIISTAHSGFNIFRTISV